MFNMIDKSTFDPPGDTTSPLPNVLDGSFWDFARNEWPWGHSNSEVEEAGSRAARAVLRRASDFWLLNIDKFLSMLALQAPKATMRSNGMRDDRYVLAIDMGSSSVKATLVSQHGELAGTGLRNVDILLLPGGGAEQDPEQWWDAAIAAAKSALATAAIPPERIVAVACTTQWAVTVPVDKGGHAIWNALSWMDTRGGRYSRAAVD